MRAPATPSANHRIREGDSQGNGQRRGSVDARGPRNGWERCDQPDRLDGGPVELLEPGRLRDAHRTGEAAVREHDKGHHRLALLEAQGQSSRPDAVEDAVHAGPDVELVARVEA